METVRLGGLFDRETKHQAGSVWDKHFVSPTIDTMQGGYREPMVIDEVRQLGFMDNGTGKHQSNTVYDEKGVCPNITTIDGGGTQQIKVLNEPQYRIRKLTPRECWRLMDFKDEDFENAAQVNSNTQLYKQAGNSIVKNVLVAIIGQMIPGKENVYKE